MKKSNKHSEIFFSSFIDDLNSSPEIVSETLKECNLDEQAVANKAKAIAGRMLAQMRMNVAKETKTGLLQRAAELLEQLKDKIQFPNPQEKLYSLLKTNSSSASFTFNSLKDFSNDDVLQMLSEIELLALIDELEKKK